jgi:hypothetical protein
MRCPLLPGHFHRVENTLRSFVEKANAPMQMPDGKSLPEEIVHLTRHGPFFVFGLECSNTSDGNTLRSFEEKVNAPMQMPDGKSLPEEIIARFPGQPDPLLRVKLQLEGYSSASMPSSLRVGEQLWQHWASPQRWVSIRLVTKTAQPMISTGRPPNTSTAKSGTTASPIITRRLRKCNCRAA